jgi:hypothetical protein
MKFECLDPLNESFLGLKVATCIALLRDGYLKVGFDGPDMDDEVITINNKNILKYLIYSLGPSNSLHIALFVSDQLCK